MMRRLASVELVDRGAAVSDAPEPPVVYGVTIPIGQLQYRPGDGSTFVWTGTEWMRCDGQGSLLFSTTNAASSPMVSQDTGDGAFTCETCRARTHMVYGIGISQCRQCRDRRSAAALDALRSEPAQPRDRDERQIDLE